MCRRVVWDVFSEVSEELASLIVNVGFYSSHRVEWSILHVPSKRACLPEASVNGCRLDNREQLRQPHEFTPSVKCEKNDWHFT